MVESEEITGAKKTASLMISYSRKDTDFVRKLYDGLVAAGFPSDKDSIWVDWEGIPLSADWMVEITKGIQSANAFIFVISPDSVKSEVCQREIEIAVDSNKRFIPILYKEPGRDAKLHEKISSHNWIFMRDEKELEEKLPALVDAINTDLDWLAQHTRLYNRASEWDGKGRNDSYLVRGSDLVDAETFISEGATGKEPAPTSLHVEYVQAARKFAAARLRRNRIIAVVVGIALLGLSIFAFIQRDDAIQSYEIAVTAQAVAEEKEKIARAAEAEAQTQREAAEANEAKARQKERVANANVLAAEAVNQKNSDTQLSLMLALLSIQETELDGTVLTESKSALFSSLNSPNVIHTWDNDGSLVWAVAIDANSRYVATGDLDGVVQIYDAESNQLVRKIKMEEEITGLDFSPDGTRIGIASGITASVWDVESGDELFQLAGHDEYWVEDIKFSPNGDLIATCGGDWNVKLWNASTGTIRTTLPGHEDIVNSIAFSGDGMLLVSGSDDDTAVLWDVESASFLNRYRPDGFDTDGNYVKSVAFDQWGTRVITGGYQTVVVWDAYNDYDEIFRLRGNQTDVYAVDFAPDSLSMLTASSGVKIWDWFYGTERYNLSSHRGEVTAAVFSEDGNYLLTGSWDNTSKLWSANLKIETLRLTQHDDLNVDAGYSPDGSWIVTTDGSGYVFVHDPETGEVVYIYEVADDEWVNAATFDPQDSRQFVTADDAGQLQLWQLDDNEPIWSVPAHDGFAFSAEFSPDGKNIVTTGDDGLVYIWDAETGDLITEIFVEDVAYDAHFSPDGSRIVTADASKIGQVWDSSTGELIMNLEGHTDYVLAAVYSHDGKFIYTGGYDNTIRKWDAETGASLLTLTGHTGRVLDLDVSPDNSLLVSGSADTTVKVWDAETGKEIFNYQGNNEESSSVAFRPDGKRVLTASAGNASKEFTVDYDELLLIAQEYELRDLTEEECLRYLKRNTCRLHLFGQMTSETSAPGGAPGLRSGDGAAIVTLIVENNSSADVDVNWIDFEGVEKTYFTLAPGEYAEQGTYSTHAWRVRDSDGNILMEYIVTEDPKQAIDVTDTGVAGAGEPAQSDDAEVSSPTVGSYYTEEFDQDLGSSWRSFMTTGEDRQVVTSFENGSLNIQLSPFDEKIPRYYLVNSDSDYSSVQLELVTTNNGNNANGVSLVCQYNDDGWYEFRISNSGFYSIDAYDPSLGYVQLAEGGSSAIKAGRNTNTYTIVCDGSDLTLAINGEQVAATTDTRFNFTTGKIGLGVSFSPEDMLPVEVLFDRLRVSEP